ncbi:hypothetical protein HD554DRAFT_2177052 [Boletus coccyginus]|nr:hypothetical protein HD554DRAFT_2177052 [Boletus coccyginus]
MPIHDMPCEIERMIFLLCARDRSLKTAHTCMAVAKRVQVWLEPVLYHTVDLASERVASKFLSSVQHRPTFAKSKVIVLRLGMALRMETACQILDICQGIQDLTIRPPSHLLTVNPLLRPLDALTRLFSLSIDLSSVFNHRIIFLPNIKIFHHITHLHITNAWAIWTGSSIGVDQLAKITHVSLCLSNTRTQPDVLKSILARDGFKVLVLWRRPFATYNESQDFLEGCGLVDKRIVVFNSTLFFYYMKDGGFWKYAERLIEWRERTNAGPFDSDTSLIVPTIPVSDFSDSELGDTTEAASDSDSDEEDELTDENGDESVV